MQHRKTWAHAEYNAMLLPISTSSLTCTFPWRQFDYLCSTSKPCPAAPPPPAHPPTHTNSTAQYSTAVCQVSLPGQCVVHRMCISIFCCTGQLAHSHPVRLLDICCTGHVLPAAPLHIQSQWPPAPSSPLGQQMRAWKRCKTWAATSPSHHDCTLQPKHSY